MLLVRMSKAAIAGLAATTMAATTGVAWTVTHHDNRADHVAGIPTDRVPGPDVAGVGGAGPTSVAGEANGSGSQATGSASGAKGGTAVGAAGTAGTSGSPGAAAHAGSTGTTGRTSVSAGTSGTGAAGSTNGSGSERPGSGPSSGSNGGAGGSASPGVTVPSVPSVPDTSVHREGRYTLFVPGTTAVNKKLCLSGEVDRCQTISVPALQGVSVTVRYSANASASAPSYDVAPCPGGLGVTVSGITPGTAVTVEARGVTITRTVGSREVSQTASLCDA